MGNGLESWCLKVLSQVENKNVLVFWSLNDLLNFWMWQRENKNFCRVLPTDHWSSLHSTEIQQILHCQTHHSERRVVGLFFLKTTGTILAWMEFMSSGITMSPKHAGMAAGSDNMQRELLSLIKRSHLLHIFIYLLCCFDGGTTLK